MKYACLVSIEKGSRDKERSLRSKSGVDLALGRSDEGRNRDRGSTRDKERTGDRDSRSITGDQFHKEESASRSRPLRARSEEVNRTVEVSKAPRWHEQVESFIVREMLDVKCAVSIREESEVTQRRIISHGSLEGSRNRSAACFTRLKSLRKEPYGDVVPVDLSRYWNCRMCGYANKNDEDFCVNYKQCQGRGDRIRVE